MKRVFVDSGGFFALLVAHDAHHARAKELWERASAEGWSLVTTNAITYEAHALLLNRTGRGNAIRLLDMLSEDAYHIERIRVADDARAWQLVRKHEDKTYSLCDALSFAVMERLHIRDAISFDRHFRKYGRFAIL